MPPAETTLLSFGRLLRASLLTCAVSALVAWIVWSVFRKLRL